MSEIESTAGQSDQANFTDYTDPDAPWNQAWDQQGGIANWNDDVIREFRENAGTVGGAYAGGSSSCSPPSEPRAASRTRLRWEPCTGTTPCT